MRTTENKNIGNICDELVIPTVTRCFLCCGGGHRACHTHTVTGWSCNLLVVGMSYYAFQVKGSVKPHFQLDETVPAKNMTKPLTDFRTGHRTVSFRMTSTVTGFFFAVIV